jgi:mRNA interferase RelE/StbE
MGYKISLSSRADKELELIEETTRKRIILAIKELEQFPNVPNLKKLKTEKNIWRRREGPLRILVEVNKLTRFINITRITQRDEAYR